MDRATARVSSTATAWRGNDTLSAPETVSHDRQSKLIAQVSFNRSIGGVVETVCVPPESGDRVRVVEEAEISAIYRSLETKIPIPAAAARLCPSMF